MTCGDENRSVSALDLSPSVSCCSHPPLDLSTETDIGTNARVGMTRCPAHSLVEEARHKAGSVTLMCTSEAIRQCSQLALKYEWSVVTSLSSHF